MQAFFCLNNIVNLFEKHLRAALSINGTGDTPHRHLKPGGFTDTDKHYRRKTGPNLVPEYVKTPHDSNHKIETLKKRPGKFVCDTKDIQFIQRTFLKGSPPNPNELKMLGGKMGIKFYRDRALNQWVIEKS